MGRHLAASGRVLWHTVLGGALLAAGVVMLVTPGPGIVTIVLGLAVLAREYAWADRAKRAILDRVRDASTRARAHLAARRGVRRPTRGVVTDLRDLAGDTGPHPTAALAEEDVRDAG